MQVNDRSTALDRPPVGERTMLALAAGLAALEGYDLACYGVTVPSLLADPGVGADKTTAGTVGSLVAVGMMIGAAAVAATVRRTGPRRLLLLGAACSHSACSCVASPPRSPSSEPPGWSSGSDSASSFRR
jgi:MFS family permease